MFNGRDFIVARNNYHADFFLREEELEPTKQTWQIINDDEYVTFTIGSPEGESLTAAEWIKVLGAGYAIAVD